MRAVPQTGPPLSFSTTPATRQPKAFETVSGSADNDECCAPAAYRAPSVQAKPLLSVRVAQVGVDQRADALAQVAKLPVTGRRRRDE